MDEYRKLAAKKRLRIHYLRTKAKTLPCVPEIYEFLSKIEDLSSSRCDTDFEDRYKMLLRDLSEFKRTLSRQLKCEIYTSTPDIYSSENAVDIPQFSDDEFQAPEALQETVITVKQETLDTDDHCFEEELHKSPNQVDRPDMDFIPVSPEFIKVEVERDERLDPFPLINIDNIKVEKEDAEDMEDDPLAVGFDCCAPECHVKDESSFKEVCHIMPSVGESLTISYKNANLKTSLSQTSRKETNSRCKLTDFWMARSLEKETQQCTAERVATCKGIKRSALTATERQRKHRVQIKVIKIKKIPKTSAERQREHRARKKALQEALIEQNKSTNAEITATYEVKRPALTAAERQRKCRAQKKAMKIKKRAKTSTERSRNCRARKKALQKAFIEQNTSASGSCFCILQKRLSYVLRLQPCSSCEIFNPRGLSSVDNCTDGQCSVHEHNLSVNKNVILEQISSFSSNDTNCDLSFSEMQVQDNEANSRRRKAKTSSERSREYRERKRALQQNTIIIKNEPKTGAERTREWRLRQKKLCRQLSFNKANQQIHPQPVLY